MDFSVLMCVYAQDSLHAFKKALSSCTDEQTLKPHEVIIMRNGAVSAELEKYLKSVENPHIRVIRLDENCGLAHALNLGLNYVSTDWIARMDADDISLPDRFKKQINFLQAHSEIDVLGTALQEFSENPDGHIEWSVKRILPSGHEQLRGYATLQSPVHHPTVMIRKSTLLLAGGYPEDAGRFEDYLLWERMMLHGAHFANLPDVLLGYRVDSGAYNRRGGWDMLHAEIALQRTFLRDGFITRHEFVKNVAIRGAYRLVPTGLKKVLYTARTALKNKTTQSRGY